MNLLSRRTIRLLGAAALLLMSAAPASAQLASGGGFELLRGTHSGSAGTSSGGAFSAQTTTSQPDAGEAEGGDFDVSGSFAEGDPADCAALAAVAGVNASENFCAGIRVTWGDVGDFESGYRLFRNGVEFASTTATVTSFDDSTAAPGVVHSYHVVAFNDCGSADASSADAGHRPVASVAPSGFQVVSATPAGDSVMVEFAWNDNSADEFEQIVYRLTPATVALKSLPPDVEVASVTMAHDGAFPYCFAVGAANCGVEARSDSVCLITTSVDAGDVAAPFVPLRTALGPLAPNPFNPKVKIGFDLAERAPVSLRIFDVTGRLVRTLRDEVIPAGRHAVDWTGTDNRGHACASGVYFVEMRAVSFRDVKRITMLK